MVFFETSNQNWVFSVICSNNKISSIFIVVAYSISFVFWNRCPRIYYFFKCEERIVFIHLQTPYSVNVVRPYFRKQFQLADLWKFSGECFGIFWDASRWLNVKSCRVCSREFHVIHFDDALKLFSLLRSFEKNKNLHFRKTYLFLLFSEYFQNWNDIGMLM